MEKFLDTQNLERPLLMEAFTNSEDESEALKMVLNCVKEKESFVSKMKSSAKSAIKEVVSEGTIRKIKTIIGKQ